MGHLLVGLGSLTLRLAPGVSLGCPMKDLLLSCHIKLPKLTQMYILLLSYSGKDEYLSTYLTLEACCKKHYGWDSSYEDCITNGGGSMSFGTCPAELPRRLE